MSWNKIHSDDGSYTEVWQLPTGCLVCVTAESLADAPGAPHTACDGVGLTFVPGVIIEDFLNE